MAYNGNRLRILRRFHDLTQRDLGERVGTFSPHITAFEAETREPKGTVREGFAVALQALPEFFENAGNDDEFFEEETYFRSLTSTPDRHRKQVLAQATLFGILLARIRQVVKFPDFKVSQILAGNPHERELAAEKCRVDWGVGLEAPIKNVIGMVERAGVVVTTLTQAVTKKIDAFSRYGRTNLIVLNPSKGSATRTRFDVAHEIGHAVLHRGETVPDNAQRHAQREDEANRFASALLLPRNAFTREYWALGRDPSWDQLLGLKERWGASVPAIVVRAYQIGLIDAAEYGRRFRFMSKEGWTKGFEPSEPEMETPELFPLVLARFRQETGKSTASIAQDLGWTPELFEAVTNVSARPEADPSIPSLVERRERKRASGQESIPQENTPGERSP